MYRIIAIIIMSYFISNAADIDDSDSKLVTKFIQKKISNSKYEWFTDMYYCDPKKPECRKKQKSWNYYTGLIGGPFFYLNPFDYDGVKYLGFTSDIPFGIQTRNGKKTKSFEAKFFNQFFLVDAQKVGASEQFDIDARLHGVQFKYIVSKSLESNPRWKPYRFLGFDLGYARMSGYSEKNGDIDIEAPTVGGAIGFGIDYEINSHMDIGFEAPIGVTVLLHHQTGAVVFPDIFPNIALKWHF